MKGFTLIEIVVTVALMMLVTGMIIANYNNFSDNQRLKQTALTFMSNLRFAQTKAFSSQKPPSCTGDLTGYQLSFPDSRSYSVQPVCTTSGAVTANSFTVSLPNNITVSPTTTITFQVLTQGVSNNVTYSFTSPAVIGKHYDITVSTSGDITDSGLH